MYSLTLVFVIIILVGIIYLKRNHTSIKGKIGEKKVSTLLSFLPKDKYMVLNDLMFKNGPYTTQIDHIVVSVYGIFIIETKNYKGWIYGNANKSHWTQNIWGNKYPLYNPIFQNKNHISFLLRKFNILREKRINIFPIVVFTNASKLRLTGNCKYVIGLRELMSYIRSFSQKIMTIDKCNYIAFILQTNNITDRLKRKRHPKNVKSAIFLHENKISQGLCPHCGGSLVLRNGKYGDFYGCSNYPRCRYIL